MLFSRPTYRLAFELAMALLLVSSVLLVVYTDEPNDLGSFIASGRAAATGLNPYGVYELTSHGKIGGREVYYPNLNPPVSLLVFEQLADVAPMAAFRAMAVGSFLLYLAMIAVLQRRYRAPGYKVILAMSIAGLWNTLLLGQIYVPLFACAVGAWLCLERRRWLWAGLLMGAVVAVKPNLGVWPLFLLLAGERRSALVALGTAAALSVLPLARYGPAVYLQWLDAVRAASWYHMPHYASLPSLAARLGSGGWGVALGGLTLAAVAWVVWRKKGGALWVSELALLAAYLASPSSSPRLALFLVPAMFARRMTKVTMAGWCLLTVPALAVVGLGMLSHGWLVTAGMVYPLGLALLSWPVFLQEVQHPRRAADRPAE